MPNNYINPFNNTNNAVGIGAMASATSVNAIDNSNASIMTNNSSSPMNYVLSPSDLKEDDIELIKKELERKIQEQKDDLENTKNTRGWPTSLGNGFIGLFGGGDKKVEKKIANYEALLASLDSDISNIDEVYKTIMGSDLDLASLQSLKGSEALASSIDSQTQEAIVAELEKQLAALESNFETAQNSNGWISGSWNWFKNWTGLGASSNKASAEIDDLKEQIAKLKNGELDLATTFKNITGTDLNIDNLSSLLSGEEGTGLDSISSAGQSVNAYSEGQKMCTDVVGDMVSGGAAVFALAAAPFTGGASLLLAASVGAGVKVAIKATDCIGNEKKYGWKDLGYDFVTGLINGAMAPISNGLGGAAGTGVAKAFGLKAAESVAKEGLEQALKVASKEVLEEVVEEAGEAILKTVTKEALEEGAEVIVKEGAEQAGKGIISRILAKQGTEYVLKEGAEATAKTTIGKIFAYGTDMAVDGAVSGATDGFARAAAEGRWEDIPQDMITNGFYGLCAAPVIGGGMKGMFKLGSSTKTGVLNLIKGFNFAEKAYNNPLIKKIEKEFVDFVPDVDTAISFLAKDAEFKNYIEQKGIGVEVQNLIYMLRRTNAQPVDAIIEKTKTNILDSSQTFGEESIEMLDRLFRNVLDIALGKSAPTDALMSSASLEEIMQGVYYSARVEAQKEFKNIYQNFITNALNSIEGIPPEIRINMLANIEHYSQLLSDESVNMFDKFFVNIVNTLSGNSTPTGALMPTSSIEEIAKVLYYSARLEAQKELQDTYQKTLTNAFNAINSLPNDIKAKVLASIEMVSQNFGEDSVNMIDRLVVNANDILSGTLTPVDAMMPTSSLEELFNAYYQVIKSDAKIQFQDLYNSTTSSLVDLVFDTATMPNNGNLLAMANGEITEDMIVDQYQKIIELFGTGPTKMAQNLSGDDTKMAEFLLKLLQSIDNSSVDMDDFNIDQQMGFIQKAMKNTKSGCSFTRSAEEALSEFQKLFPSRNIVSVNRLSAASVGETFIASCDNAGESSQIIVKIIKKGVTEDALNQELSLISHVLKNIAGEGQEEQVDSIIKLLGSLYESFVEELDFKTEANANRILNETLERSTVANVLDVSADGRALTMEIAEGIQANKLMAILKEYKSNVDFRKAVNDMVAEYAENPQEFKVDKYLDESVYDKKIGTYAKLLQKNPALSDPIKIMTELPNTITSSLCEQMIFVKQLGDTTGTIMHGDPHSGNFFVNFTEEGLPKIQYIDTGNVVISDSVSVTKNLKFFLSYFVGDTDSMAEYLMYSCDSLDNKLDLSPDVLKKYISDVIKNEIFSTDSNGQQIGQNVTRFNEMYESITILLSNLGMNINAESANYYKAQGMFLDAIVDSSGLLGNSGFSIYSIIKDCPVAILKMLQNNTSPKELIVTILDFLIKNPKDAIGSMWQFVLSEKENSKVVKECISTFN